MEPESEYMAQVLEQGISVDAHEGHHCQRQKGHRHNNDPHGSIHGNEHQLRISHQRYQNPCLNSISGFHHTSEQLTGVGVIGRNRIDIGIFPFFHMPLPAASAAFGDVHDVPNGDKCLPGVLVTDVQKLIGVCLPESGEQVLFAGKQDLPCSDDFIVDEMDSIAVAIQMSHLPIR